MDRLTSAFWLIIWALLGASVFYGVNAESQRRSAQQAEGKLDSGDVVRLVKIIDGDTILVNKAGQENTTILILGIQAFESKIERDVTAPYGQAAVDALEKRAADKPIRVLLHSTPKDKHGRTIATLFVDDNDLGLSLISDGHVLAYPVYPFPSLPVYLREQAAARAAKRGFWANNEVVVRADALIRDWRKRAP
ncbi:MAG: thermonuclease family protein [Burkholderiales bacterium]|nr:thermonuclease family protein [Burkholderiales bacterium]